MPVFQEDNDMTTLLFSSNQDLKSTSTDTISDSRQLYFDYFLLLILFAEFS